MNPSITKFTPCGQEVRPGVREPIHSNLEKLTFSFHAVCDTTAPEQWHGEVSLAGHPILSTAPTPSWEQAGRAAEAALLDRLVQVLGAGETGLSRPEHSQD
jgi:hypothetical protein